MNTADAATPSDDTLKPDFLPKMEILKLLADIAEREADRMWTRYMSFFYINTALIGIITIAPELNRVLIAGFFAPLGFVTSVAWLKIIPLSFFYQDRWIRDMKVLIDSDATLRLWIMARGDTPRTPRPPGSMPSLQRLGPLAFLVAWIAIAVYAVVELLQRR